MGRAPDQADVTVHATCIALRGRAALLRGPSGAGKSDLALRCMALGPSPLIPAQARLIADDRVVLHRDGDRIIARAPATIAGRIEVRGLGIVPLEAEAEARVVLLIDLKDKENIERMPPAGSTEEVLGVALPRLALSPFEASAALKVLVAINNYGVAVTP